MEDTNEEFVETMDSSYSSNSDQNEVYEITDSSESNTDDNPGVWM